MKPKKTGKAVAKKKPAKKSTKRSASKKAAVSARFDPTVHVADLKKIPDEAIDMDGKKPAGPTMSFYDWVDMAWDRIYQRYALDDTGCVVDDPETWLDGWRNGEDPEYFGGIYAEDCCDLDVLDIWTIQSYENRKSPTKLRFPGVNPEWKKPASAEPEPAAAPAAPIGRKRAAKVAKAPKRPTAPAVEAVQLDLFR